MSDFMIFDEVDQSDGFDGNIIDLEPHLIRRVDDSSDLGDAASHAAKIAAKEAAKEAAQKARDDAKAAKDAGKVTTPPNTDKAAAQAAKALAQQQRKAAHIAARQATQTSTGNGISSALPVDPAIAITPAHVSIVPIAIFGAAMIFLFFVAAPGTGSSNE